MRIRDHIFWRQSIVMAVIAGIGLSWASWEIARLIYESGYAAGYAAGRFH